MSANAQDASTAWTDPDEAPEWTEGVFDRAALYHGETLVQPAQSTPTRRGRPRLDNPKRQVTLRLDGDVIDRFRQTGPGWQSRINDILRKAVKV